MSDQISKEEAFQTFEKDKELRGYLAGAIDCDGAIVAQFVRRQDYILGWQIRCTVQLSQSIRRKKYIEEICEKVGLGYIRTRKNMCDWIVADTKQVKKLLEVLKENLKMKKDQAVLVLEIIEKLSSVQNDPQRFLELANLVDDVSILNDSISSKRIHTSSSIRDFFLEEGFI